jgi:hypothetical protein
MEVKELLACMKIRPLLRYVLVRLVYDPAYLTSLVR